MNRRTAIKRTGALALALGAIEMAVPLAFVPERALARTRPSDIQYDIDAFLSTPPQASDTGVLFRMPPVHTVFLTATLGRTPTKDDQDDLNRVLGKLERHLPWGAAHLVTFLAYGVPYFSRLPGGLHGRLVSRHMPRLLSDNSRYALEEAVPGPTDVGVPSPFGARIRFTVPVQIESNDMLFTLRSDNPQILSDVLAWLAGSNRLGDRDIDSPDWDGLISFTSSRYQFVQMGLPKAIAMKDALPFRNFMQHDSPMWMGFADQHTNASGPPPITTFVGNSSARFTTAAEGDYFDNGSIQHLSHVIIDMLQWFDMDSPTTPPRPNGDGGFIQRVQYMFHSPKISVGNADQYTDGGGPSFLPAENRGPDYALHTIQGIGTDFNPDLGHTERRMGHLSTLQRSSRAADGTPIHIRVDGPGYDNMDVPDGSNQPKNQFSIFVPTADFFATMRTNMASLDYLQQFGANGAQDGLERQITATRRQNFLVPPRRNRAFPLTERT